MTAPGSASSPATASGHARLPLWLKLALGTAVLGALVLGGRELAAYVPAFASWVDSLGVWGPVVFGLGYAVATVAFIPGWILTLAAGAVFGLLEGTLIVFVGATAGAASAFLVARYLARGAIERRLEGRPRFQALDRAVGSEGLKIVLLMRLSPVFPYNLLNYALGLTRVRFRDYMVACLGMLPGTFLYVYYGAALGSLAEVAAGTAPERGVADMALKVFGLLATLVVTVIVARIARRALQQEVPND